MHPLCNINWDTHKHTEDICVPLSADNFQWRCKQIDDESSFVVHWEGENVRMAFGCVYEYVLRFVFLCVCGYVGVTEYLLYL